MKLSPIVLGYAQVVHFTITLSGFLGLLFVIVVGGAKLDPTSEKLVYTMLGVLGTIVTQQAGYFYARQRPDGAPPETP
jgi:hypothetical protein